MRYWSLTLKLVALGFFAVAAQAKESRPLPITYSIALDGQRFSLTVSTSPDDSVYHQPKIDLKDESLFEGDDLSLGLKLNWTHREGIFRKVAGVLQVKVFLARARASDVRSLDGVKRELLAGFKRNLGDIGYTGSDVPFETTEINGREWLHYVIPVLNVREYALGIAKDRFLRVRFAFIDNTSSQWHAHGMQLMDSIVASLKLENPIPQP